MKQKLFFCQKCKRVWQWWRTGSNIIRFEYLYDFPTYGLPRLTCPECNREEFEREMIIEAYEKEEC